MCTMNELQSFQDGWGEDPKNKAPTARAIQFVKLLLLFLNALKITKEPSLYPREDGGIEMQWKDDAVFATLYEDDLEFTFAKFDKVKKLDDIKRYDFPLCMKDPKSFAEVLVKISVKLAALL